MSGALARGEVDVLLVSPERLNNPRFRDEQLPDARRAVRPARRRRGPLRQRLGPRLPARLPPHPRPADDAAAEHAGARDDGDGQRPRRHRRRRAARRRRPRRADAARAGWPGRRCGSACCRSRRPSSASPGSSPTSASCPAVGHRLRPDGRRPPRTSPRRCARPATRCAAYTGRTDPAERDPARGGAARQRGQGPRRDLGARHGLRQARPRVRPAPRRPVVAGRLLPAGRSRGPRHRARRRAAPARPRGQGHLALLRLGLDAHARSRPTPSLRALAESPKALSTVALESIVDVRRTRLELLLKVLDVDGAVQPRARRLDRDRSSRGPTTPSATGGSPRPASASRSSWSTTSAPTAAAWPSSRSRSTTTPPSPAAGATGAPAPWFDTTIPEAAVNTRPVTPRAAWRRARVPGAVAVRHGPPRRAAQGEDRARRVAMDEGRAVARLERPRLGPAAARAASRRGPRGPGRGRCGRCVDVLAGWGWRERPGGRSSSVPSRRRPLLVELVGRGHRPSSGACPTSGRSTSSRAAPSASRAATARSGWPTSGAVSRSGPELAERAQRHPRARCCSSTTSATPAGP